MIKNQLLVLMLFFSILSSATPNIQDSVKISYDLDYHLIFIPRLSESPKYGAIPGYGNSSPNHSRNDWVPSGYYDETGNDTPLRHGASTLRFGVGIEYDALNANFWGLAEHRGFSYGVYNEDAMYIIPRFNVGYVLDTVFGFDMGFALHAGNFDRAQTFEGLTLNNTDVQGVKMDFSFKNGFGLRYFKIGDLNRSIGYGLEDFDIFQGYFQDSIGNINYNIKLGLSVGNTYASVNNYSNTLNFNDISLSAEYFNNRFYSQLSRNKLFEDEAIGAAMLFGYEYSGSFLRDMIDYDINLEYRYYDEEYNRHLGYRTDGFYNRKTISAGLFHSGDIYPIYNTTYRMENWGLYQNYPGRQIADVVFFLNAELSITETILFKLYSDNHFIFTQFKGEHGSIDGIRQQIFYTLYKTGFEFRPAKGLEVFVGFTNYDMELRSFFPTFAQYRTPTIRLDMNYIFNSVD